MKVEIVNRSKEKIPAQFVKNWVFFCQNKLQKKKVKIKQKNLIIAFVKKSEIQKLNKKFRKKNKPTDILSFESLERGVLGELVIAPQVIKKQAKLHGLSFQLELGYMILHGILHLLGFDHEKSKKEAKKMFDLQDHVFDLIRKNYD